MKKTEPTIADLTEYKITVAQAKREYSLGAARFKYGLGDTDKARKRRPQKRHQQP